MTCGSRRDNVQSKCSPVTPHFFKIILEETLGNNKLQIPKKFVMKYGGSLSSRVFLKLPCGLGWKVGLTKSDGKVWMDKGFKTFAEFYSIGRGHLLVFRYEGNSQFHVILLDTSTMEIDYPSSSNHFEKHDMDRHFDEFVEEETEDDDVSIQVLDSFPPCPKARDKSPLPCSRSCKRMRTIPFGKTQSDLSHLDSKVKFDWLGKAGGNRPIPPRCKKPEDFTRKPGLNAKQKAEALKRASGFKSKDPFFYVVMQQSFIGTKSAMILPSLFARKHLCNKHYDVMLKVPDGRTWSVKYSFRLYNGYPKAKFGCGWKAFAQDNGLKVGDVCAFVLTKSAGILLEVSIFCENGVANSAALPERCQKALTHYGRTSSLERASRFQPENPFFTVAMKASYTTGRSHFCLPYKFAETYINRKECEASLWTSYGNSWTVQFKVRRTGGSSVAEFRRGWKEFARDNSLEVGNICTFELTNGKKISFKVSIGKVADDAYNHLDKSRKLISEETTGCQVTERPSSSGVSRASAAASHFSSTNPYFRVAVRSDHMKHCTMHVPTTFSKRYFDEMAQQQTVILRFGERTWPVKVLSCPSRHMFSAGWSAFARDNFLQPRDVCIFELTKGNELELKVSIFRQTVL